MKIALRFSERPERIPKMPLPVALRAGGFVVEVEGVLRLKALLPDGVEFGVGGVMEGHNAAVVRLPAHPPGCGVRVVARRQAGDNAGLLLHPFDAIKGTVNPFKLFPCLRGIFHGVVSVRVGMGWSVRWWV